MGRRRLSRKEQRAMFRKGKVLNSVVSSGRIVVKNPDTFKRVVKRLEADKDFVVEKKDKVFVVRRIRR